MGLFIAYLLLAVFFFGMAGFFLYMAIKFSKDKKNKKDDEDK